MRAALLPAQGAPLEIVERPTPEPGPGEARVRIEACGVCGSDLFLQKGGFGPDKFPVIPGHEAAGVVDALGPGVDGPPVGEQVAIYYISNTPNAPRPNLGPGVRRMGVDVDGAFAEYVVRPVETLIPVAGRIDPATLAVLTDAVGTPYHALAKIGRVQPGETVAVLGIGGIGSNAVQVAAGLGADVVAISRSEEHRELARRLGARVAVTLEEAAEACGPLGPDVVVQCAASASMDEAAIALGGYGARIVLVATTVDAFQARASDFVWRELSVMGSRGFTADDIREVIDLYRAGRVRTDHLTARVRPLEEANEALEDLRAGRVLRSVLVP
ncbi:MAG TPA: alcohol dehydrogenase catalytic domain-containing protein [Solirubrobacteraceae bacterium]|nr:alcohol dehydrogenase catalytic domain-containing protein [Solirubrobacteraceae bacterium]